MKWTVEYKPTPVSNVTPIEADDENLPGIVETLRSFLIPNYGAVIIRRAQ
jgi:hypothetical protein